MWSFQEYRSFTSYIVMQNSHELNTCTLKYQPPDSLSMYKSAYTCTPVLAYPYMVHTEVAKKHQGLFKDLQDIFKDFSLRQELHFVDGLYCKICLYMYL